MSRPLNFRQLEAFRAVMLTGSMTGAGHAMSISQPAVSRLIHDLEHELKLVLFQRLGSQIVPTEEATQLYREVERHFAGAERIRDAARAIKLSTAGYLHIGAMPNLSAHCLPEAVSLLLDAYPDVVVSIHPDSSINLMSMLRHGQLDVAFGTPPADMDDLDHDPFPPTRAVCIMPRAHPLAANRQVTIKDLHDQDFVSLGQGSRQRMQLNQALLQAGVRPNIRLETLHSSSVIRHVSLGVGIAITDPIALLGPQAAQVAIRPFLPAISMEFSAVYRRRAPRSRVTLALTDILQRVVADELRALQPRTLPTAPRRRGAARRAPGPG